MKALCFLMIFPFGQFVCGSCPCKSADLCNPITNQIRKEIFVFSLQNNASSWNKFDWTKITTVSTVGYVSQDLMCLAHEHGARVVTIANFKLSDLMNSTAHTIWVKNQLSIVQSNYYDGINIDFEDPIPETQPQLRDAYTKLAMETFVAFKSASKYYQVSIDVAWSPSCIDQRCYDYKSLAYFSDFLFVMAYDEQSQIVGDCTARANSHYLKTLQGVNKYLSTGISFNNLVLGVPWYGYDYKCLSLSQNNACSIQHVPFRGVNCSDAAGRQIDYRIIYPLLVNGSTGMQWDYEAQSPFFNYKDPNTGQLHQVRYDDPVSLKRKYEIAVSLNLRGVGTWNIDCLDFSDAPYAVQQTKLMFNAFPTYEHNEVISL